MIINTLVNKVKYKDKGTSSSKDKSDEQVLIIIVFIISLLS